jgi:hypothetical protein
MLREGSWSKSNSYWGTSQFKPPNGTLGASNGFVQQLMTALASSRVLELGATAIEEWPTNRPELRLMGSLQNRRGHRRRRWLSEILTLSFLTRKEEFIARTAAGADTRLKWYREVPVALWSKLASGSRGVRAKW